MFPITLSFNIASPEQLVQISALFGSFGQPVPQPAPVVAVVPQAEQAQPAKAEKPSKRQAAVATQEQPTQSSADNSTSSSTDTADQVKEYLPTQAGVLYAAARELVLKLAATHREEIKKINAKHGIAKLSVLLSDENDFGSVTDQAKLDAVFADLQAIGA